MTGPAPNPCSRCWNSPGEGDARVKPGRCFTWNKWPQASADSRRGKSTLTRSLRAVLDDHSTGAAALRRPCFRRIRTLPRRPSRFGLFAPPPACRWGRTSSPDDIRSLSIAAWGTPARASGSPPTSDQTRGAHPPETSPLPPVRSVSRYIAARRRTKRRLAAWPIAGRFT